MHTSTALQTSGLALLFVATLSGVALAGRGKISGWTTLYSERHGYLIAYPGSVFTPDPERNTEDGTVLVSKDGAAKLMVGTFENETQASLEDYRSLILEQNYAGADLDYAPQKSKWFVVSGTRGDMHFYERVSFTCGGKLINSWALIYPVAERRFYDRVVEAIAPTYTPGAGRTGECD